MGRGHMLTLNFLSSNVLNMGLYILTAGDTIKMFIMCCSDRSPASRIFSLPSIFLVYYPQVLFEKPVFTDHRWNVGRIWSRCATVY